MLESIVCFIIYIITVIVCAVYIKKYECKYCKTLGELFSEMNILCFLPGFNTALVVSAIILSLICMMLKVTGIIWVWNKLMNIKI